MRATVSRLALTLVLALLATALGWPAAAQAGNASRYSAYAYLVKGTVLGNDVGPLVKVGPFDQEATFNESKVLFDADETFTANPLDPNSQKLARAQASLAQVTAASNGNHSTARATVSELDLLLLPGDPLETRVQAEFVSAEAQAKCANEPIVSGDWEIANLVVSRGDTRVAFTDEQLALLPNEFEVLGVRIVKNSQSTTGTGDYRKHTSETLRVVIPGVLGGPDVADVVVAGAEADIQCARPARPPCERDFVTGGAWYYWPTAPDRSHVTVHAGLKNGEWWGRLGYHNRKLGEKVHGSVLYYGPSEPLSDDLTFELKEGVTPLELIQQAFPDIPEADDARFIIGRLEGTSKGSPFNGAYVARVRDGGESGGGKDELTIAYLKVTSTSGQKDVFSYDASPPLHASNGMPIDAGNIQHHTCT